MILHILQPLNYTHSCPYIRQPFFSIFFTNKRHKDIPKCNVVNKQFIDKIILNIWFLNTYWCNRLYFHLFLYNKTLTLFLNDNDLFKLFFSNFSGKIWLFCHDDDSPCLLLLHVLNENKPWWCIFWRNVFSRRFFFQI